MLGTGAVDQDAKAPRAELGVVQQQVDVAAADRLVEAALCLGGVLLGERDLALTEVAAGDGQRVVGPVLTRAANLVGFLASRTRSR